MRAKSASGLPVGFACMPFIIVFIESTNALSAGLVAGFIAMPFMFSAPKVAADDRKADRARAAKTVDVFMMRSFRREQRRRGSDPRLDRALRVFRMQPK